jgi:hypothetical protein
MIEDTMRIRVFWDVVPCCPQFYGRRIEALFSPTHSSETLHQVTWLATEVDKHHSHDLENPKALTVAMKTEYSSLYSHRSAIRKPVEITQFGSRYTPSAVLSVIDYI